MVRAPPDWGCTLASDVGHMGILRLLRQYGAFVNSKAMSSLPFSLIDLGENNINYNILFILFSSHAEVLPDMFHVGN